MGTYSIKPQFQRCIEPLKKTCVDHKISPDLLNVAAVVIACLIALIFFISRQNTTLLITVPFLVFLRLLFNALDGMVARATGVSSAIGEVHNEVLDRVSDAIIILSFGLSGHTAMYLSGITCAFVLLSSYMGIVSKAAGGSRIYNGIMCKPDRMIIIGLTALTGVWVHSRIVWNIGLLIILVGTAVTSVQRYIRIRQEFSI